MKTVNSKYWWWRKFLAANTGSKAHDFFKNVEPIAFYYELGRRNFALGKYPDFTKLNSGQFDIAVHRFEKFASWSPPAVIDFGAQPYEDIADGPYEADGFIIFSNLSWNLRASKNSLQKTFWSYIEFARRERGIKIKNGPNANNSARTAGGYEPWNWLELIDCPKGLGDNDRSKKSVAKTKMQKIKKDFIQLWKEIEYYRTRKEQYYLQHPAALKYNLLEDHWDVIFKQ